MSNINELLELVEFMAEQGLANRFSNRALATGLQAPEWKIKSLVLEAAEFSLVDCDQERTRLTSIGKGLAATIESARDETKSVDSHAFRRFEVYVPATWKP